RQPRRAGEHKQIERAADCKTASATVLLAGHSLSFQAESAVQMSRPRDKNREGRHGEARRPAGGKLLQAEGQRVERASDGDTNAAEVDYFRLVTEQGGSPPQVADMPAVAACQQGYPHEEPPRPAPPDRVIRVTGECCDCIGRKRGGLVFFCTWQTGCKKGLRLLRGGPLEVDALEDRTARSMT